MKQLPMSRVTGLLALFTSLQLSAQDLRTFNQNASRSNNRYLDDNWTFGINSGGSFGLKSSENTLFRGNSMATKMFGRYYFGNMGLGFTNGIIPGTINDGALNGFITDRKFPQDQLQVSNSKPFNSYFLFGPSFRFGKRVEIGAEAQGGMFINNPGAVTIGQSGAQRPLYRFDSGDKNLFPGFSGSIHIAYPINHSTRFFINSDYLQSKSSIRLFDPQQGIDVATQQNRDLKMFTAGVGIIKSFGTKRDAAGGRASRKRSARDAASGLATGRIISTEDNNALASPRDAASGLATGRRTYQPGQPVYGNLTRQSVNESCGPVTLTTTNPDGTSEQRTFSCPNDAMAYTRALSADGTMPNRISMNVTTPKQTQGATFGEKVNQGLHAAGSVVSQGASRGTISGTVNWGNGNAHGITTNETAAVSSVGNLAGGGSGAAAASYAATGRMISNTNNPQDVVTTIYARDAASGRATGRRSRDAGSGMATGRRQYEPVFTENGSNNCTNCTVSARLTAHELTHIVQQKAAAKTVNPLYTSTGTSGNNPMHERNSAAGNGGGLCGSTGHFLVILVDEGSGQPVAKTTTDSCGNFWFANVPEGNYGVRIKSEVQVQKNYEVDINKDGKYDVAGEILSDDNQLTVQLSTSMDDNDNQKSKVTVRGWDPEKKESVVSSAFVAGSPIGGIVVKGGKNPGGNMRTTQTNEHGEFEFTDWEKGNYLITAELKYTVDETMPVSLFENNDETNERKGWDGTVKGGSKVQDHNSSRSNKTASIIDKDGDNTNERKGWDGTVKGGSKVQDHNSSRSNKSTSLADNTDNGNETEQQERKLKGKIIKTGDNGMIALDASEPVTFRWTPLVPKPKEPITYRLRVWQLMQGQNGTQAMRSDAALVDKTVGDSEVSVDNLLTGPCKPPYLCDFIWSVQTINSNGTTGKSETGTFSTGQTKAQNNNTVRSNRTELKSILIEADTDGDGTYETDVTNKVNDEVTLDENGNIVAPQQKAGISTSRSNIRTRSSLKQTGDDLYVSYGNTVIDNKETPVRSILKTKHDTVKNSISNIR